MASLKDQPSFLLLKDRQVEKTTFIYLCSNFRCSQPVDNLNEYMELVKENSPTSQEKGFMFRKITFLLLFLSPYLLLSQQVPQYTLYSVNPYAYNPAYAGAVEEIGAAAAFRGQWIGLEGAPLTQNLNIHLPISYLNSGIGMNIENDMLGALRMTRFSLGYAYGMDIKRDVRLSFGVSGGLIQSSLDGGKLLTPDGEYGGATPIHNDNLLPETVSNAISYSIDAGIYLKTTTFDAGISMLHLTESEINYDFNDVTNFAFSRHFLGFAAYKFDITNVIGIRPSVLIKSDLVQHQLDVSIMADYNERYMLGLGFRGYNANTTDAFNIGLGLKVAENWTLFYAYDITLSELNTVSQGSHEVVLKYNIAKTLGKGILPKIIHNPRLP